MGGLCESSDKDHFGFGLIRTEYNNRTVLVMNNSMWNDQLPHMCYCVVSSNSFTTNTTDHLSRHVEEGALCIRHTDIN